MDNQLQPDASGLYFPENEEQLVALVKTAYRLNKGLRVRGSGHSVAAAIYTDPLVPADYTVDKQTPPAGIHTDGQHINVALSKYRGLSWVDETQGLLVADAGIYLGRNSMDPTSTVENSLLYQLGMKGWALSDLGGITEQSISGFISTGSSGGSLQFSVYENILGLRLIDGLGNVYEVFRDKDFEGFHAAVTSMGLLGVISKVYLKAVPTFNITGQEAITTLEDASVDMFGDGTTGRPSLEQFLRDVEYTRLEWWPQRHGERLVVWQAQRIKPQLGFRPVRYEEFTNSPEAAEIGISIFYTIIGNLDDLSQAAPKLRATFKEIDQDLTVLFSGWGEIGKLLAAFVSKAMEFGVDIAIAFLQPFAPLIKEQLPSLFNGVLDVFIPLDSTKKGMDKNEPQSFRDWGWQGLPMDNQASDVLAPTEFTEIWIPLPYTQKAMVLLRDYFAAPGKTDQEALARTGTYAFEIYAAKPNPFWMSMSHSDGRDEWKDGVVRVDAYWFVGNAGNPAEVFYPQFWKLFREAGIPFRLHWGKFQPMLSDGDPEGWVEFFRKQYPRWDDFLARRREKDPQGIFFTEYWRQRFGQSGSR